MKGRPATERRVLVTQGSLTEGTETLLVNASNTNARLGSGVSGAIGAACGLGFPEMILSALNARHGGPMSPGAVFITDAGTHPTARYVAHVAVMDYRQGFTAASYPTLDRIRECCVNLWREIEELPEESISVAMVALGGGTGKLGVRHPTEVACTTLEEHFAAGHSRIGDVTFYCIDLPEYLAMVETVSQFFEIPSATLPEEVRRYLARVRSE
jgi:O-acetyl-ADP-ribose deacetylase (regulator of RNase III)